MYTLSDIVAARENAKKRMILSFMVLALAIIVLVIGLVLRMKWIATFGTAIVGCAFYWVLEMKAMPYLRYRRFLDDIEDGLSRETDAEFTRFSEKPRLVNGVSFYDCMVRVGPEDEDERLFYYDAVKPLPKLEVGKPVHIVSFGNYITQIS